MRIAVVGTGYVGLVSGTSAETGVTVPCPNVDVSIDKLNQGGIPILDTRLRLTGDQKPGNKGCSLLLSLKEALVDADAVFIAVGTPPMRMVVPICLML